MERGSIGPLFQLSRRPQAGDRWFARFGLVFEDYVLAAIARACPDSPELVRRFFRNPMARDAKKNQLVELADAALVGPEGMALFEVKAAFTRDSATSPHVDPDVYLDQMRGSYGVSGTPRYGDRSVKALGQLARTVSNLSDGCWVPAEVPLSRTNRILPILLVHDGHLDAPLHSHALAREFAAYLGVSPDPTKWEEMRRGTLQVAHLIVVTADDFEMLEGSDGLGLVECLDAYARSCPDRIISFHNYLATLDGKKLRANPYLVDRAADLMEKCAARLFPDKQLAHCQAKRVPG
jgi:hypothetical protein